MFRYFRGLNGSRTILWCYLIWYLGVAARYFESTPTLWLSSLGISAIVGTALYLSTARAGVVPVALSRWAVFRLYLMPFCVSSFAALIKGRGFILVFHPNLHDNLTALVACLGFVGVVQAVKRVGEARAAQAQSPG